MTRYRFGDYRLDDATGELTGPGGSRRLEPQPARVLSLLLRSAGELVPGETLQREIWGDAHIARDEGLAYCIRQVRAALGDQAAAPRFLETLPRRGYRFLVPVEVAPAEAADRAGAAAPAKPTPGPVGGPAPPGDAPRAIRSPPRTARWLGAALLAVLALAASLVLRPRADPPTPSAPGPLPSSEPRPPAASEPRSTGAAPAASDPVPVRLAILPLAPAEGPPGPYDRELARALVAALASRGEGRIEVVGPATTAGLDLRGRSQPELGRELAVGYLLSGGSSPDGEIVFLQLIRAADGAHLWARRIAAAPPDELAAEAAQEILGRLEPPATAGAGESR